MIKITNSTSAYLLAICSMLLLIEAGCKTSTAPTMNRGTHLPLLSELAPSDILSRYDTSNLEGIIVARKELYSIVSQSSHTNWDGTWSWGQAQFADISTGDPMDVGAVGFNVPFANTPVSSGPSGDYSFNANNLPIYTDGSTNNIVMVLRLDSTQGSAIDSLTFGVMPIITNITRGQNISRDSNITVNWTGTSSDFVCIMIDVWDSTGTHDTTGHGFSIGAYYNNTGSATLSLYKDQLVKGLADVELRKYQPKFITLSNGKRVAVICET